MNDYMYKKMPDSGQKDKDAAEGKYNKILYNQQVKLFKPFLPENGHSARFRIVP